MAKTFCAAAAVLHWIATNPDVIAITTAPTWTQVERVLSSEIHKALRNSVIRYPIPCKSKLELGPNRYALGLSTNEGVRFQGWHCKILIVIDEARGDKRLGFSAGLREPLDQQARLARFTHAMTEPHEFP